MLEMITSAKEWAHEVPGKLLCMKLRLIGHLSAADVCLACMPRNCKANAGASIPEKSVAKVNATGASWTSASMVGQFGAAVWCLVWEQCGGGEWSLICQLGGCEKVVPRVVLNRWLGKWLSFP